MFDPQRRAATPELKAAIKSLIAYLEQREADLKLRKRARREADRQSLHLAIEAIACNLAGLSLTVSTGPSRFLAAAARCGRRAATASPCMGNIFSMLLIS
jgi:hypothetical protein